MDFRKVAKESTDISVEGKLSLHTGLNNGSNEWISDRLLIIHKMLNVLLLHKEFVHKLKQNTE